MKFQEDTAGVNDSMKRAAGRGRRGGQWYRGVVIISLVVAIAVGAWFLVRLQMAMPLQRAQYARKPQAAGAASGPAHIAQARASEKPQPGKQVAGGEPGEQLQAEGFDSITFEAWVEGGKLHLQCNVSLPVEVYPLDNPQARQTLTVAPGHATTIDLDPGVVAQAAGKVARLQITLKGRELSLAATPEDLKLFVNRLAWPNDRYRAGEGNRIGFNFPAEQPLYGIALTKVILGDNTPQ